MRTNGSLCADADNDNDECAVCTASTAPAGSRNRLYPAPRARNFTLGSAWPWLASKISGNCPRMARGSGFECSGFECSGFECSEDLEELGIGEAGS